MKDLLILNAKYKMTTVCLKDGVQEKQPGIIVKGNKVYKTFIITIKDIQPVKKDKNGNEYIYFGYIPDDIGNGKFGYDRFYPEYPYEYCCNLERIN